MLTSSPSGYISGIYAFGIPKRKLGAWPVGDRGNAPGCQVVEPLTSRPLLTFN
jgi:hypothetical protein